MALQGGNQTDEDFIFDQTDEQPAGNDGGGAPSQDLPEDFAAEPVDSRMVSEAIRGLIAPNQAPVARAPTAPVPAQPAQQEQQRQPQDDMTPRERGLLRDLQEERARRREMEDRANGRQPAGQQQQRDIARELFENPEQVLNEIKQDFGQQIAQVRLTSDLEIASMRHPEVFQDAFNAFMAQVGTGEDARTYHRIMTAPSPGQEIVNWFQENTVLREVGNDPKSYKERLRAELMAEMGLAPLAPGQAPQAQPQQQETAPAARLPNGQFAPRSEVRLPTSIGRLSGGKSAANQGALDGSDDAIFNEGKSPRK